MYVSRHQPRAFLKKTVSQCGLSCTVSKLALAFLVWIYWIGGSDLCPVIWGVGKMGLGLLLLREKPGLDWCVFSFRGVILLWPAAACSLCLCRQGKFASFLCFFIKITHSVTPIALLWLSGLPVLAVFPFLGSSLWVAGGAYAAYRPRRLRLTALSAAFSGRRCC